MNCRRTKHVLLIVVALTSFFDCCLSGKLVPLLNLRCNAPQSDKSLEDSRSLKDYLVSKSFGMTLCTWVKPCMHGNEDETIITLSTKSVKKLLQIKMNEGKLLLMVQGCRMQYEEQLPTWLWSHLCVVLHSTDEITLFFNKEKVMRQFGRCEANIFELFDTELKITIGTSGRFDQAISGYLADVRLYYRELAQEGVLEVVYGNESTVDYFSFQESSNDIPGTNNFINILNNIQKRSLESQTLATKDFIEDFANLTQLNILTVKPVLDEMPNNSQLSVNESLNGLFNSEVFTILPNETKSTISYLFYNVTNSLSGRAFYNLTTDLTELTSKKLQDVSIISEMLKLLNSTAVNSNLTSNLFNNILEFSSENVSILQNLLSNGVNKLEIDTSSTNSSNYIEDVLENVTTETIENLALNAISILNGYSSAQNIVNNTNDTARQVLPNMSDFLNITWNNNILENATTYTYKSQTLNATGSTSIIKNTSNSLSDFTSKGYLNDLGSLNESLNTDTDLFVTNEFTLLNQSSNLPTTPNVDQYLRITTAIDEVLKSINLSTLPNSNSTSDLTNNNALRIDGLSFFNLSSLNITKKLNISEVSFDNRTINNTVTNITLNTVDLFNIDNSYTSNLFDSLTATNVGSFVENKDNFEKTINQSASSVKTLLSSDFHDTLTAIDDITEIISAVARQDRPDETNSSTKYLINITNNLSEITNLDSLTTTPPINEIMNNFTASTTEEYNSLIQHVTHSLSNPFVNSVTELIAEVSNVDTVDNNYIEATNNILFSVPGVTQNITFHTVSPSKNDTNIVDKISTSSITNILNTNNAMNSNLNNANNVSYILENSLQANNAIATTAPTLTTQFISSIRGPSLPLVFLHKEYTDILTSNDEKHLNDKEYRQKRSIVLGVPNLVLDSESSEELDVINYSSINIEILSSELDSEILMYFSSSVTYTEANKMCLTLGGTVPVVNLSDTTAFDNRVNLYAENLGKSVTKFWVLNDSTSDDAQRWIYCASCNSDLKYTLKNINSAASILCEVPKGTTYKIISTKYSGLEFNPISTSPGEFQTTSTKKIKYFSDTNLLSLIDINAPKNLITTASVNSVTSLMGRHEWGSSNNDGNNKFYATFTSCKWGQFTCSNGLCIDIELACDKQEDCSDRSDEMFCTSALPLPSFYNSNFPTDFRTSEKLPVTLDLTLDNVLFIDMKNNLIKLELTFVVKWRDSRLSFKFLKAREHGYLHLNEFGDYWLPSVTIEDATYSDQDAFYFKKNPGDLTLAETDKKGIYGVVESYEAQVISGTHVVLTHSKEAAVEIRCSMNLFLFPFDIQVCRTKLILATSQRKDVKWDREKSVTVLKSDRKLGQYGLKNFNVTFADMLDNEAEMYIKFERKFEAYIFNTFLPCIIMETIGLLTNTFPYEAFEERIMVTLSLLVVLAALFTQVSNTLPESTEPKLIDIWMFAHVAILFLVFVGQVFMNYLFCKTDTRKTAPVATAIKHEPNFCVNLSLIPLSASKDNQPRGKAVSKFPKKKFLIYVDWGMIFGCVLVYLIFLVTFLTYAIVKRQNVEKNL